jgi:cation diffusion facilitator family transporter
MFILTTATAIVEIVYGIRAHSNSLIADGLYSFAEGLCLVGVILVLRYSHEKKTSKNNTFGYERLELLFGLMQEVFLLSVSLGIIVDAVNHLVNPIHINDPMLVIILGGAGIVVGLLGILMFWGYHHDHNIQEQIHENKRGDFLSWTKKQEKARSKTPRISIQSVVVETPLMIDQLENDTVEQLDNHLRLEIKSKTDQQHGSTPSILDSFTYEHVELEESRIYATLHALCLHSIVINFSNNKMFLLNF